MTKHNTVSFMQFQPQCLKNYNYGRKKYQRKMKPKDTHKKKCCTNGPQDPVEGMKASNEKFQLRNEEPTAGIKL